MQDQLPLLLAREIIASMIRDGVQPYIEAGFTLDWIRDPWKRLEHLAVVPGLTAEYEFILRYTEKYGVVPTREIFLTEFPTCDIPWDSDYLHAELLDQAHADLRRILATDAAQEFWRHMDAEDTDGALALLRKTLDRLDGIGSSGAALPFRLLSLDDIENLPDPEPLIEGVIDHGTVSMLAGESGKGKSFVAIDWALHVATGRSWFGRQVRQGRVLYVAAEGAFGLKKRIRAWQRSFGRVQADSFVLVPDAVQLAEAGQLQALVQVAKDFDFVVIDTLARTSSGLEENSARDMGVYVDALYKIRNAAREAGNTTLVVHHTGYDTKRARGSSSLFANIDGQVLIQADDPHGFMKLTVKKRKDGEVGEEIGMRLLQVSIGDSTSCVVEQASCPEEEASPRDLVLGALARGPKNTREIETLTNLANSTADRTLKALVADGMVTVSKVRNSNSYSLAEMQ